MKKSANISDCGKYRYTLSREWDSSRPTVLFVCLNPSTADASKDDPTIRRLVGFAKQWGYGKLWVANLFAFRATKPEDMKAARDPIGPKNDFLIQRLDEMASLSGGITVAAWGAHGNHLNRAEEVLKLLRDPYHLGLTKGGQPRHPLYLPKNVVPVKFGSRKHSCSIPGCALGAWAGFGGPWI